MNFLLRTMAWQVLLEKGGVINTLLGAAGLPSLEIINTPQNGNVRIEGNRIDVIFSWMQLTASIAESLHVPLQDLLAQCMILGPEFERLNRAAEDCRIDLSRPGK